MAKINFFAGETHDTSVHSTEISTSRDHPSIFECARISKVESPPDRTSFETDSRRNCRGKLRASSKERKRRDAFPQRGTHRAVERKNEADDCENYPPKARLIINNKSRDLKTIDLKLHSKSKITTTNKKLHIFPSHVLE